MEPYICPKCNRGFTEGDVVIPAYIVENAIYLVRVAEHTIFYIHVRCI